MLGDDLLVAEGGPAVLARLLQKGRQRAVARGDEEQLASAHVSELNLLSVCIGTLEGGRLPGA